MIRSPWLGRKMNWVWSCFAAEAGAAGVGPDSGGASGTGGRAESEPDGVHGVGLLVANVSSMEVTPGRPSPVSALSLARLMMNASYSLAMRRRSSRQMTRKTMPMQEPANMLEDVMCQDSEMKPVGCC